MSSKLVWILAGGATIVVLGGAAIWWRWQKKKAARGDGEQPPTPEPERAGLSTDSSTTSTGAPKPPRPAFLARDQLGLFRQASTTQATGEQTAPGAAQPKERENTRRWESADHVAEAVTAEATKPAPIVEESEPRPSMVPTVLIPKRRRKRYSVGAGELIELRPDRARGHVSWSASRPDVEVRVLEQDESRALVALDGPAGEVNIALLCDGPKGPRPITSWKFEIVDKVA